LRWCLGTLAIHRTLYNVTGEEEGLAKMSGYYFFLVADRGQIDARVPPEH